MCIRDSVEALVYIELVATCIRRTRIQLEPIWNYLDLTEDYTKTGVYTATLRREYEIPPIEETLSLANTCQYIDERTYMYGIRYRVPEVDLVGDAHIRVKPTTVIQPLGLQNTMRIMQVGYSLILMETTRALRCRYRNHDTCHLEPYACEINR